jgi:hypothetical protein
MAKLIVELPDEIHRELKKTATLRNLTLKEVVTDLVKEYLARAEKSVASAGTGLCGSWEDTRTAAAIIADIRKHRSWLKQPRKKVA